MVMVKIAWLYKKHGDGDDYDGDDYGVGNMMEIMVLIMMVIMMANGEGCGYVACD